MSFRYFDQIAKSMGHLSRALQEAQKVAAPMRELLAQQQRLAESLTRVPRFSPELFSAANALGKELAPLTRQLSLGSLGTVLAGMQRVLQEHTAFSALGLVPVPSLGALTSELGRNFDPAKLDSLWERVHAHCCEARCLRAVRSA